MKIPLKRFKHVGSVVTTEDEELDNSNDIETTKTKFKFIYANIHTTLNSQLSNLGNSQNSNRMIAVQNDIRFDKLINNSDYQIQLDNGNVYRISQANKDDSQIDILYTIGLVKNDSNSSDNS